MKIYFRQKLWIRSILFLFVIFTVQQGRGDDMPPTYTQNSASIAHSDWDLSRPLPADSDRVNFKIDYSGLPNGGGYKLELYFERQSLAGWFLVDTFNSEGAGTISGTNIFAFNNHDCSGYNAYVKLVDGVGNFQGRSEVFRVNHNMEGVCGSATIGLYEEILNHQNATQDQIQVEVSWGAAPQDSGIVLEYKEVGTSSWSSLPKLSTPSINGSLDYTSPSIPHSCVGYVVRAKITHIGVLIVMSDEVTLSHGPEECPEP